MRSPTKSSVKALSQHIDELFAVQSTAAIRVEDMEQSVHLDLGKPHASHGTSCTSAHRNKYHKGEKTNKQNKRVVSNGTRENDVTNENIIKSTYSNWKKRKRMDFDVKGHAIKRNKTQQNKETKQTNKTN